MLSVQKTFRKIEGKSHRPFIHRDDEVFVNGNQGLAAVRALDIEAWISRDGLHAAYLADFPAMVEHRPSGEILRLLVFEFDVRENLLSCEFFRVVEIAHVVKVQDIPVAFFLKPEDEERNPQPIENDVNGFLAIQFFKGDGTAHKKTAVGAERFEDFGDSLHTG